jgi:glycosyltransferase involved in cell wall biosynthesis
LVSNADIVQLEWWNHPATIRFLSAFPSEPIRLLPWCHVSGLHTPVVPPALIQVAHRFLFTSACSLEAEYISALRSTLGGKLGVVSSGCGLADLPEPKLRANDSLRVAYFGSLNFAKLHPKFVEFLAAVDNPGFRVRLIGDSVNREELERQCARCGRPNVLDFRGYATDIVTELESVDVLAYLLNPQHYGTAENALLEAMAMGIVPIVLANPCERQIVEDGVTGFVVATPAQFAAAIERLADDPQLRVQLSANAARSVRQRYTEEQMEASLNTHYAAVMQLDRRQISFRSVFGDSPAAWFLSCQEERDRAIFRSDGTIQLPRDGEPSHMLFERSKGTVFHFRHHFPGDPLLIRWAQELEHMQ